MRPSLPFTEPFMPATAIGYLVELEDATALRRVATRLFDDRSLSPDQRRDLANALQVIIWRIEANPVTE